MEEKYIGLGFIQASENVEDGVAVVAEDVGIDEWAESEVVGEGRVEEEIGAMRNHGESGSLEEMRRMRVRMRMR